MRYFNYFKNLSAFLLAAVGSLGIVNAQDIHFSQFYAAPLHLNPALTGVSNCNGRFIANYRNQWASVLRDKAYSTYSASYDQKIATGRYDYFGIGGNLWADKAGSLNYRMTQAHITGSYSKRLGGYRNEATYLVAGVDAGVSQRGIDYSQAIFGSQYNGNGGGDPNQPSGENGLMDSNRDQTIHPDFGLGLLLFGVLDDNKNYYVGGAYHHINRANVSFYEGKAVPINPKITLHAGAELPFNERATFLPNIVAYMQGPNFETNLGTSVRFLMGSLRNSTEGLQIGLWSRISNQLDKGAGLDALILSTKFDYDNFSLGMSYDINTSSLKAASRSNGGFEFSLMYKICGREDRDVYCPNF